MKQQAQRVADLRKNYFYLQPEKWLDMAIENALSSTKAGAEKTMPYQEALRYKVLAVDEAESIALALGTIKQGTYKIKDTEEEKVHAYPSALAEFKKVFPEPDPSHKEEYLNWQVRLANFKLRLIINALQRTKTSTIEFEF